MRSTPPPAATGTIKRIGRSGQAACDADVQPHQTTAAMQTCKVIINQDRCLAYPLLRGCDRSASNRFPR